MQEKILRVFPLSIFPVSAGDFFTLIFLVFLDTIIAVMILYIENRLLEIRKSRRMTLRQLSEISAVSRSDINRIERGETDPRISTALLLADVLECSVDNLFILHK